MGEREGKERTRASVTATCPFLFGRTLLARVIGLSASVCLPAHPSACECLVSISRCENAKEWE